MCSLTLSPFLTNTPHPAPIHTRTTENWLCTESQRSRTSKSQEQTVQYCWWGISLSPVLLSTSSFPLVQMKRQIIRPSPLTLHAPVSRENIAEKLWKQHKIRLQPEDIKIAAPFHVTFPHSGIILFVKKISFDRRWGALRCLWFLRALRCLWR